MADVWVIQLPAALPPLCTGKLWSQSFSSPSHRAVWKDGHERFSISITYDTTSWVVCLVLDFPVQEKTVMFWSASSRGPPTWLVGWSTWHESRDWDKWGGPDSRSEDRKEILSLTTTTCWEDMLKTASDSLWTCTVEGWEATNTGCNVENNCLM